MDNVYDATSAFITIFLIFGFALMIILTIMGGIYVIKGYSFDDQIARLCECIRRMKKN